MFMGFTMENLLRKYKKQINLPLLFLLVTTAQEQSLMHIPDLGTNTVRQDETRKAMPIVPASYVMPIKVQPANISVTLLMNNLNSWILTCILFPLFIMLPSEIWYSTEAVLITLESILETERFSTLPRPPEK